MVGAGPLHCARVLSAERVDHDAGKADDEEDFDEVKRFAPPVEFWRSDVEIAHEREVDPSVVSGGPCCEGEDCDEGEDEAHAGVEEPDRLDEDSCGGAVARAARVGGHERSDGAFGERVGDGGSRILWGV